MAALYDPTNPIPSSVPPLLQAKSVAAGLPTPQALIWGNQPQPAPVDNNTFSFVDSAKLKSGKYPTQHVEGLIKASKAAGVDPYQAVALGLQESGLNPSSGNSAHRHRGSTSSNLAQINDFDDSQQKEVDDLSQKTGISPMYLKLAVALKDKLQYAKQLGFNDEASQLQAYNGYGMITKDRVKADKVYGVPVGNGIDMRKNPLYGKRLVQLKNDLKKNEYVQHLVSTL